MALSASVFAAGLTPNVVQAQSQSFPDAASTEQMLADQLIAMAWMAFGREAQPRPDQLQRARVLLDMAAELSPDDEGMWELRVALGHGLQDQSYQIDALTNYLRLQPKDDVAQLQLIQAQLSSIESLDIYLAKLERMLRAEGGEGILSAPLRSRLASMAAQSAQEIGDPKRSAGWLGYALKLDPVNPDAARMIYQLALDRGGSARQQGAALVNLLKASPIDPGVRASLANLLMQEAVYTQALEQYGVAMTLVPMQARMEMMTQYALCLIAADEEDQVQPLLLELQLFLKQMQDAQNPAVVDETLDDAEPEAISLDDLPGLPPSLEMARLILMEKVNPVAAADAFERMKAASGVIEDAEERQELLDQLIWVGAVFGQGTEWVQGRINQLEAEDETGRLASGWLALRRGETAAAVEMFESLGEDNYFARLGLASLPDLDEEAKAQAYQEIIWDSPSSMAAVVCAHRLNKMRVSITPTSQGVPLRSLVDDVPKQMWTPAFSVSPWIRMKMTATPGSFGFLQPMRARVNMFNATRFPLALGPGGAMTPVLMVSCSPSMRNEPMGPLSPTFFSLGRRLTLPPGEGITIDVRLDRFHLGQLTAQYPTEPVTFSATGILDPRAQADGSILPGSMGGVSSVSSLMARGTQATPSNLQLWIKDVDSTDSTSQALAIARLLAVAGQPAESTEALELRDKVRDTISQRYPNFDRLLQAWTVRFMLPDEEGDPVSQRVIDLAQRSDDPLVRIVYLVMNVDAVDAPALTDAIRHDNPTIRSFAEAMRTGFEEDAMRLAESQGEALPSEPLIDDGGADPLGPILAPSQPSSDSPSDAPWLP